MKKDNRKEISGRTAVKALINGFVSYGIIFTFIIIMIILFYYKITSNVQFNSEYNYLLPVSLLKSIIFFILILFVCRISTFDLLKKCKVKSEDIEKINKNMSHFFIICCVFSLLVFSLNLTTKYLNKQSDIYAITSFNYYSFKDTDLQIARDLTKAEVKKKNDTWFQYKICSSIIELSILASCIYLMPYQKKMIELYN